MSLPSWVETFPQGNVPLSPRDYHQCFPDALSRMSTFLYGHDDWYELHEQHRDDRISDDEAAREHFYSGFKLTTRNKHPVIVYELSQAFFAYTYRGLHNPDQRRPVSQKLKKPRETDTDFLKDCAANYLIKNFWHNYVHDRAQRITDSNYRLFRHESRYYSDFEADNFANILLPLSYGMKVAADHTTQSDRRPEIGDLYARNRCNTVFVDRARARRDFPAPNSSYDSLQDWEWQIRRRFANQLAMRLIENNRAVSSITMHFFGEIRAKRNKFTRPETGASIELNGVRITFEGLGDIGSLSDEKIRESTGDYVAKADVEYCTRLRHDPSLKKYALDSLRAKCEFLVGRPIDDIIVKADELPQTMPTKPKKKRAR
jgi:hypothetical protein